MEIKNKKAFTLLEVLLSIILLSIIVIVSVKAYTYFTRNSQKNIIDYMALAKTDNEMNRLVYAYENLDETEFTENANNSDSNASEISWMNFFKGGNVGDTSTKKIYKINPLDKSYGLMVSVKKEDYKAKKNIIEIIDNNNNPNNVDVGDIVGMMAWKVHHLPNEANTTKVNLSLSLTYPYLVRKIKEFDATNKKVFLTQMDGSFISTINLKTATKVK